ncbi:FAD-dependent oxidoreductase [Streptomyces sp. NBC_01304]|uniref:FAD-dependent oxidoreductase n=1 Tax=Streptomyces sp. NBC_01304 TaxID=2903818 RepID=UPI002E149DEF|nr:FAD-dependent monooxygenase [Streptomyces sp. NBC_01304]
MNHSTYDVAIVGGSIAGCTAAILYARAGARVALIERHKSPDAYKVLCNHYIQPSAVPLMRELGVTPLIERAGAPRTLPVAWWTRWGWIEPEPEPGGEPLPYGFNVRRETLDPIVRRIALDTEGVDVQLGAKAVDLVSEGGRTVGVRIKQGGEEREIRARLVVGADGRNSSVAEYAGIPTKSVANSRFSYFAYYRGDVLPKSDVSYIWFGQDMAYANPTDGGLTAIACAPGKSHLPAFKADLDGAYTEYLSRLPGGPDLSAGERVSKIIGTTDYPLLQREPTAPGLALVGDAGLCSDPIWGVGVGWAFQSASWLVAATKERLHLGPGEVDRGLAEYRREHRARLRGQQFLIADYAGGRPMNPIERQLFAGAVRDPQTARHLHRYASRFIGVREFLAPRVLARAGLVNARHRIRGAARTSL